jgi:hypothetical protein
MPRISCLGLFALSLLLAQAALAQATSTSTAASDPQALALAANSLAALTGGATITDVTITGTATRVAGSDVGSGPVTLKALGTGESRLDLNLSNGARSEARNLTNGPSGSWVGPDGIAHAMASHNCMTDSAWFFPALSALSQASSPSVLATYVGQETRSGLAVQHVRFITQAASAASDPTGLIQSLSTEDLYLDASSSLPVAFVFSTHPDNNAATNIPVEIDFSNYQLVNGASIPFRIQKFFNGTLLFDITVQSVALNSGLTDAAFATN